MGGAERQALYLVEHLAGLDGCEVEVLTFEDGTALRPIIEALGVRIHVVPYYFRWPKSRRAAALARLGLLLRQTVKPDALLPFVGIHSKTMAQVWPFSGARFCWWNQQDEGRDLTGTSVESRILKKASCITSNSLAGREFLSETYGLAPESILVYNNGTPMPGGLRPGDLKERLNIRRDRAVVSMIANITSYKDHETLVEAWANVHREFDMQERPILLLAGHLRERETVSRLKTQAFDLGLSSDDLRFLGPVDDVGALLSISDAVVHSSLTEGCPNSVCEAMSFGRAVVATDIPGCRQALGDGEDEWLAAPRNARDMASKLVRLLSDSPLRESVGARNRHRIETEFSIAGMNAFFQSQIEQGLGQSVA